MLLVLAALLRIQNPADAPGKAVADGPSAWVPALHMGDLKEIPAFWLQPGLAASWLGLWGMSQQPGASLK